MVKSDLIKEMVNKNRCHITLQAIFEHKNDTR